MEGSNRTHSFTEIIGEYIAEKEVELAHERLLAIAERSLSEGGEGLFTLRVNRLLITQRRR